MCRATKCHRCQKTTWAGCGQHVNQVMSKVPRTERCSCDRTHLRNRVRKRILRTPLWSLSSRTHNLAAISTNNIGADRRFFVP